MLLLSSKLCPLNRRLPGTFQYEGFTWISNAFKFSFSSGPGISLYAVQNGCSAGKDVCFVHFRELILTVAMKQSGGVNQVVGDVARRGVCLDESFTLFASDCRTHNTWSEALLPLSGKQTCLNTWKSMFYFKWLTGLQAHHYIVCIWYERHCEVLFTRKHPRDTRVACRPVWKTAQLIQLRLNFNFIWPIWPKTITCFWFYLLSTFGPDPSYLFFFSCERIKCHIYFAYNISAIINISWFYLLLFLCDKFLSCCQ